MSKGEFLQAHTQRWQDSTWETNCRVLWSNIRAINEGTAPNSNEDVCSLCHVLHLLLDDTGDERVYFLVASVHNGVECCKVERDGIELQMNSLLQLQLQVVKRALVENQCLGVIAIPYPELSLTS